MKPIYALHKDSRGQVLTAASFGYSFELNKWLGALDVRAGDRIEFAETATRPSEDAPALDVVA